VLVLGHYTEIQRIIPLEEDILTLGHNTEKPARFVRREGIRFPRKVTAYDEFNKLTADYYKFNLYRADYYEVVTDYEVGKLALDLLPTLLSTLKPLGGPGMQEISVFFKINHLFTSPRMTDWNSRRLRQCRPLKSF